MDINKEIYYGLWWLPEKPEEKIYGFLRFQNSKATLFTIDSFTNTAGNPVMSFTGFDLIQGLATNPEEYKEYSIKLLNPYQQKSGIGVFNKRSYKSDLILIAKPNSKENSSRFKTLMLSSSPWKFWVEESGFKKEMFSNNDKSFGYKFAYEQPKQIQLYQNDEVDIHIFFRASASYKTNGVVILREEPFFNLEFKEPRDLEGIFEIRTSVERLLMILIEEPHLFSKTEVRSIHDIDFKVYDDRREIGVRNKSAMKYRDFVEDFEPLYTSWLDIKEKYDYPIRTFFFALTGFRMDIHNKFLNFVFALEQFHKKCIRELEPLSEKNRRMFDKVISEVKSGDALTWLKSVLNKGSNIRFSKRLTELLDYLGGDSDVFFEKNELTRIEKTRHYLVHLEEKHKEEILLPEEIVEVNEKLIKLMLKLLKKEVYSG
jgi:hypothetical protein